MCLNKSRLQLLHVLKLQRPHHAKLSVTTTQWTSCYIPPAHFQHNSDMCYEITYGCNSHIRTRGNCGSTGRVQTLQRKILLRAVECITYYMTRLCRNQMYVVEFWAIRCVLWQTFGQATAIPDEGYATPTQANAVPGAVPFQTKAMLNTDRTCWSQGCVSHRSAGCCHLHLCQTHTWCPPV